MDGELGLIIHKRASFTRECDHIWLTLLRTVKESAEYGAWITYGTQSVRYSARQIGYSYVRLRTTRELTMNVKRGLTATYELRTAVSLRQYKARAFYLRL